MFAAHCGRSSLLQPPHRCGRSPLAVCSAEASRSLIHSPAQRTSTVHIAATHLLAHLAMDKYEKLEKLGEGAHGVVVKARVRTADQVRQERRVQRRREEEEEKGIATILGQVRKQNRHAGSRADARDCRAVTAAAPRARVASESQLIAALSVSAPGHS